MLSAMSVVMGILTVMTQIVIPFAADLSPPRSQGKAIGTVMSGIVFLLSSFFISSILIGINVGLLLGILLSRTISGWVGLFLGWRAIYWGACFIMTVTTIILFFALPSIPPTSKVTIYEILRSLGLLLRTQPLLWQSGLIGAAMFGSFSCFWTTVTFRLSEAPYFYNSGIIGLFSLIGAAGVLGSPLGGFLVRNRFYGKGERAKPNLL